MSSALISPLNEAKARYGHSYILYVRAIGCVKPEEGGRWELQFYQSHYWAATVTAFGKHLDPVVKLNWFIS